MNEHPKSLLEGLPHIVVAEDDVPSANVLCAVLRRAGYRVTVAADGMDALRLLEEEGLPDLLLLDWMLPGVSGLDICQRVRRRWDPLILPVLMVTARADAESIAAAFEAGANDYITKPYLGAELRARIASHLRTKRLIDEQRRMEDHLREEGRLSSLGLLVSGVAHDLNNPLTGIGGYAQLLLQTEEDAERQADLRHIVAEVERCRRIVGGLLSFARRHPVERSVIDLAGVVRRTLELREQHLRSQGLNVMLCLDEPLPALVGDPHQLQQVFLNIVLNAEHALRQRGQALRISAHSARDLGAPGEWIVVEFFNDGPPIPPEIAAHVFSPFFTTKAKDEGTGLGLAICQRIVREHGGEIRVSSEVDGTTFRLELPAFRPAEAGVSPAAEYELQSR